MKAYLDTNIVSAIAKDDTPAESHALNKLMALRDSGDIELVTSQVALGEIVRIPNPHSNKIVKEIYELFEKVSFIDDHRVVGFYSQWDQTGGVSYPFVEDDPVSTALMNLGIERTDAHHIMVAVRAECQVFLSCDKGILNRRVEIEVQFQIEPMKPSDFVKKLA